MILQMQERMKIPIKKYWAYSFGRNPAAFYLLFLLTIAGCSHPVERPRDPWVFRSVLDERPRMISMALHEDLWSAYDTQKCGLFKAWKGDVIFDGAVYTTKHGPQPTTSGTDYLTDPLDHTVWSLHDGTGWQPVTPDYRGHRIRDGQVILSYQIGNDEQLITIRETPEYISDGRHPGLMRTFEVEGLEPGKQMGLKVTLQSLPTEFSYATTGDFQVETKESSTYGGITTHQVTGILMLNNGSTSLESYFSARASQPRSADDDAAAGDALSMGAGLIENGDCKTCHNETERTVGPSYLEIAQRYPSSAGTIRQLSFKIITGGTGNWGEVPMTAHPDLTEPDAEQMVRFILSLDHEAEAAPGDELLLRQPSVSMNLSGDYQGSDASDLPGLATGVYLFEGADDPRQIISEGTPILSGVSSAIHVVEKAYFGNINNNIAVEFKGTLAVAEDMNADFRLVSDDGSYLYINDRLIIDHGGFHSVEAKDGEVILKAGKNDIRVVYFNGAAEGAVSLQWAPHGAAGYEIVPAELFTHQGQQIDRAVPHVPRSLLVRNIPGDQAKLAGVHPSFDLAQARPPDFKCRIGGMDFMSDGSLLVSTWDSLGPVYKLEGVQGDDPESIKVTRIATGLAEPLGLKVVDDEIYVLQKQELTKLIDHDGDNIIDEYLTICDDWKVSANFHEFAFGLEYMDGYFYATLATAIMPGGASASPQIPDRGKAIRISKETGEMEFVAHGLRTPNGIGTGIDQQLFIADNQGDWLPSSKIVHLQRDAWYGSRSVDFEGTARLTETQPVVWLPQDEIGNSPSMPLEINVGPYMGQMIHGEVTHGGIKRVYVESVNNQYQGAVFRFSQGLEAGVNRMIWGPDGSLYVGGVGSSGNWNDGEDRWYGLQRLTYNDRTTFEMLAIRARTDGLELEFTAPIEAGSGHRPEEYRIQQWYYLPTENYGGPKLDLKDLEIRSIHISQNRKKVFLELPGMEAGHVIHVRIYQPFRSSEKQSLWTTEAWYNMNQIPANEPGFRDPAPVTAHNALSPEETEEGWELLFDGKTTSGWRNFQSEQIGPAWKVVDGTLMLDHTLTGGGDIITEGQYQDYELALEWKIAPGGNSGIMFNVQEDEAYERSWHTGPEVQILDNLRHADARIETHRSGDLYDMIAGKFVTANGPDEWNQVRIVSENGKVSHWQNGYEVVTYEMHTPEWDQMVANSKFKDRPGFGKSKSGHIALQDHGDRVWFRNIKIKQL